LTVTYSAERLSQFRAEAVPFLGAEGFVDGQPVRVRGVADRVVQHANSRREKWLTLDLVLPDGSRVPSTVFPGALRQLARVPSEGHELDVLARLSLQSAIPVLHVVADFN